MDTIINKTLYLNSTLDIHNLILSACEDVIFHQRSLGYTFSRIQTLAHDQHASTEIKGQLRFLSQTVFWNIGLLMLYNIGKAKLKKFLRLGALCPARVKIYFPI